MLLPGCILLHSTLLLLPSCHCFHCSNHASREESEESKRLTLWSAIKSSNNRDACTFEQPVWCCCCCASGCGGKDENDSQKRRTIDTPHPSLASPVPVILCLHPLSALVFVVPSRRFDAPIVLRMCGRA